MKTKTSVESVVYRFGGFDLNADEETLFFNGKTIPLNHKSYECLHLLIQNVGRVVKKEEFFNIIWKDSYVEEGILAVNISSLRKTLEENDSSIKYIQTIPRNGYRFIAKVEKITNISSTDVNETEDSGELNETQDTDTNLTDTSNSDLNQKPKQLNIFKNQTFVILGLFIALIGFGAGAYFLKNYIVAPQTIKPKKIAIFPLVNIRKITDSDYFSLAFTDSLNTSLYSLPNLVVTSTSQMKQFLNQSYDPVTEGRKLGVDVVIIGSFDKTDNKFAVNISVIDLSISEPITQTKEFVIANESAANIQAQIIRFVVNSINLYLTEKDVKELKKRETQNPLAYEYFLRGSNAQINNELDEAINFYNKSLELDPEFEIAYENIALAYLNKGNAFGCGEPCSFKATEILNKILQKSPDNLRVKTNLGQSLVELNQPERAIQVLNEVTEQDTSNFFAYNTLSYVYRFTGLLDKANAMFEKSKDDQQLSLLIQKGDRFYNNALLYKGDYTGFLKSLDQEPDSGIVFFYKGLGNYYNNNFEKAAQYFNNSYQEIPEAMITQIGKVYVYQIEKNETAGLILLEQIYQGIKINRVYDSEMIYKTAQAFAVYNQKEKALELFDLSIEKGFFCYPYLINDPLLNNIRNEPKFQITLEKAKRRYENFKSVYDE